MVASLVCELHNVGYFVIKRQRLVLRPRLIQHVQHFAEHVNSQLELKTHLTKKGGHNVILLSLVQTFETLWSREKRLVEPELKPSYRINHPATTKLYLVADRSSASVDTIAVVACCTAVNASVIYRRAG